MKVTGVHQRPLPSISMTLPIPCTAISSCRCSTPTMTNAAFGDAAFNGAVPSGFTSGFPAGAAILSYDVLTQIAAEAWGRSSPAARLTQISVEAFGASSPAMRVTQVAREMFGSVSFVPTYTAATQIGAEVFARIDHVMRKSFLWIAM